MSYTPNTWQTGDTITAAKLNNMEQGIASAGGGALVVNVTLNSSTHTLTCDKTGVDVYAAYQSGTVLFTLTYDPYGSGTEQTTEFAQPSLVSKMESEGHPTIYFVRVNLYSNDCTFEAQDNGYLSYTLG